MRFMIKPTHICNLKCSYCYEYLHDYKSCVPKMELSTFEKFLQLVKKQGAKNNIFCFIGGEIAVMGEDWLCAALDLIKEYQPDTQATFQTNLVGMDTSRFQKYIDEGMLSISSSYDGKAHNELRDNSFDAFYENFKKLEDQLRYDPVLLTTASKEFMSDYYGNTVDILQKFKGNFLIYRYMTDVDGFSKGDYEEYIGYWKGFIDMWLDGQIIFKERTIYMLVSMMNKFRTYPNTCSYNKCCLGTVLTLQPDGQVTPCDQIWEFNFGTVDTLENLGDAFFCDKAEEIKGDLLHKFSQGACSNCYFKDHCGGGCWSRDSYLVQGDAKGVSEFFCNFKMDLCNYLYERIMSLDEAGLNLEELYTDCRFTSLELFQLFLKQMYGGTYASKL